MLIYQHAQKLLISRPLTIYGKLDSNISGGIEPVSDNIGSIPELPENIACTGGTLTFVYTVDDFCKEPIECPSTFKVAAATKLEVSCPTDPNLPACTSAADILKAYDTWVAGFSVEGGCSPTSNIADIPKLPADFACAGANLSFTLTANNGAGYCVAKAECSSTFKVAAATKLEVFCPTDPDLPACTSAADIQKAYDAWVAGFSVKGGCSPTSNIADIPKLPADFACAGANLSFTLTANNGAGYCVAKAECSSTFKVAAATKLEVSCPTDPNLPACTSAADILKAYDTWVAGFSVKGGCSPTSNIADIPKLPADYACAGADLSFTLTANNKEGYCVAKAECSSTFKVAAATKLEVSCPTDPNLPACTSAADILKAYDTWVAGFIVKGGCSPTSNIADIPKLPADYACAGADLSFTLTANNKEGYCVAKAECSSTFKVAAATKLEVSCPTDPNLPACTSAADIQKAYDAWIAGFSVKGGCSPTSNIADIPTLPADYACAGADLSFTLTANNTEGYCVANAKCSSTFKVAAATKLEVSCPTDPDLPACTSAADIQKAYDAWIAGFSVTDGCSPTSNIADIPTLPADYACAGANLSFTLTANNAAGYCVAEAECSSTFKVAAANQVGSFLSD